MVIKRLVRKSPTDRQQTSDSEGGNRAGQSMSGKSQHPFCVLHQRGQRRSGTNCHLAHLSRRGHRAVDQASPTNLEEGSLAPPLPKRPGLPSEHWLSDPRCEAPIGTEVTPGSDFVVCGRGVKCSSGRRTVASGSFGEL